MSDFFPRRPKKEPLELQLTAMIDVFSMIVIFLIFGTVFGAADIVLPIEMRLPKSISKEGIESAPRVSIEKEQVKISLLDTTFPVSAFRTETGREQVRKLLQAPASEYQKKMKTTVTALNLLADQETPYQDIYDVVATFRTAGFNTILFVATGGAKQ